MWLTDDPSAGRLLDHRQRREMRTGLPLGPGVPADDRLDCLVLVRGNSRSARHTKDITQSRHSQDALPVLLDYCPDEMAGRDPQRRCDAHLRGASAGVRNLRVNRSEGLGRAERAAAIGPGRDLRICSGTPRVAVARGAPPDRPVRKPGASDSRSTPGRTR